MNYHGYLKHAFADVDWADVIFDRRQNERRQQQSPWMVDRRASSRRARPEFDARVRRSAGRSCASTEPSARRASGEPVRRRGARAAGQRPASSDQSEARRASAAGGSGPRFTAAAAASRCSTLE